MIIRTEAEAVIAYLENPERWPRDARKEPYQIGSAYRRRVNRRVRIAVVTGIDITDHASYRVYFRWEDNVNGWEMGDTKYSISKLVKRR